MIDKFNPEIEYRWIPNNEEEIKGRQKSQGFEVVLKSTGEPMIKWGCILVKRNKCMDKTKFDDHIDDHIKGYTIPGFQKKILVYKVEATNTKKQPPELTIFNAPANPLKPLNWNAYVVETLRRRKLEKLTQKTHAALADVCVPTMYAFEKGDLSLSLKTAFKIMKVVGLYLEEK